MRFSVSLVWLGIACACASPTQPADKMGAASPAQTRTPEDDREVMDDATSEALLTASQPKAAPDNWPTHIPWVTDSELAFEQLLISPAGDIVVEWSIPGKVNTELSARLAVAFEDASYERARDCNLVRAPLCKLKRGGRMVTLYAPNGSSLELHLYPANLKPLANLPNTCVIPPKRKRSVRIFSTGINQDGERFLGERTWAVDSHEGIDLDSDGALEVYVPHVTQGDCPWEIPHDVYIMRGKCGHLVGTIIGNVAAETRFATIAGGLRTVTTTAEWAASGSRDPVPVAHTRTRRYAFDGRTLRIESDNDRTGRCHHCAKQSCSPAKP